MKDFALWLEENGWVYDIGIRYYQYREHELKEITDLLVTYLNEIKNEKENLPTGRA